jgi:hypothetical protein
MWRTSIGDRKLSDAEQRVWRHGVSHLLSCFETWLGLTDDFAENVRSVLTDESLSSSGIAAFEKLTPGQRLHLTVEVAEALFSDAPVLPLTQEREATVAAIFEGVRYVAFIDIDDLTEAAAEARGDIAVAYRKLTDEPMELEDIPLESLNADNDPDLPPGWDSAMFVIENSVLWNDYDWELDDLADMPPEIQATMGVPDGYYGTAAHDPTVEEAVELYRRLRALVADHETT